MKRLVPLLLLVLALPLHAEIRGAIRGGMFTGGNNDTAGTAELDVRIGNWAVVPAYEVIAGGYGTHAVHVNARRMFQNDRNTFWVGAGPTWVSTNESSGSTINVDLGYERRMKGRLEPFVAARYYQFNLGVFRDSVEDSGVLLSVGLSVRIR